jgi:hypothetical protein
MRRIMYNQDKRYGYRNPYRAHHEKGATPAKKSFKISADKWGQCSAQCATSAENSKCSAPALNSVAIADHRMCRRECAGFSASNDHSRHEQASEPAC